MCFQKTAAVAPGQAGHLRSTPSAVSARSCGRSMKYSLNPLAGLLACGLLAGLTNTVESTEGASYSVSPHAATEYSRTARLGDDFSILSNGYTNGAGSVPSIQSSYTLLSPSIVELLRDCVAQFRFAVEDVSPEERQTALAE
ncbi:hypothetical protein BIW11_12949 [Tropilaelaps mercedesae]|uniref:Uncharacterized protein n=1 Tax=Tropilaelaps mercedesae TaxID=418985 RepID=A0A1V9X428_9ACAR|nr:hypothetical protein BIW11_12949 [Tropilaelaps mercedesae]